jgi:hypothetical protein
MNEQMKQDNQQAINKNTVLRRIYKDLVKQRKNIIRENKDSNKNLELKQDRK